MRYLLDASALLPLITRRGRRLLEEASRESLMTTDMAVYEACNSLWKLVTLLKTVSLEDAKTAASALKSLTTQGVIRTLSFTGLDLNETLERSCQTRLTFYDASYITAAEAADAVLVTEDKKLQETASKSVRVIAYEGLEGALNRGKAEG